MKPIRLVMQAFGPYKNREVIEFDKLCRDGIFLIKGPTGSGKTSIFDAMTIALYGGSTGLDDKAKNGRNNLTEWRCNQSENDTDTIVEFTFSVHDVVYRFTRRAELKRKNLSESYDASILGENGVFVPLFENPKKKSLDEKAVELLGLTKEQFRQVVLLPQGQFEKFLTANSGEKEVILKQIFGTDAWERYAQRFYDNAIRREKELKDLKHDADIRLSGLDASFTNVDDILIRASEYEEKLKAVDKSYKEFDAEAKQKELDDEIKLSGEFKVLHNLENDIVELEGRKHKIDDLQAQYDEANKAESVREYIDKCDICEKNYKARSKGYDKLAADTDRYVRKKEEAAIKLENHKKDSKVDIMQRQIGELESKKDIYSKLDSLDNSFKDAKKKYEVTEAGREKSQKEFDKCKSEKNEAYFKWQNSKDILNNVEDRYFRGIYGIIAEEHLKEGEKCPVCGSTHHPEVAKKTPDSVTEDELKACKKEVSDAFERFEKISKSCEEKENAFDIARKAENDAKLLLVDAENAYKEARRNLVIGVDSLAALNKKIKEINRSIEDYNNTLEKIQEEQNTSEKNYSEHIANVNTAKNEAEAAKNEYLHSKDELDVKLKQGGFDGIENVRRQLKTNTERDEMLKIITEYKTSFANKSKELEEKKKALSGKTEPDSFSFVKRRDEITSRIKEHSALTEKLKNSISSLKETYEELKLQYDNYFANIGQVESDLKFAKNFKGNTGIGIQRYVLGIMFGQVIAEANLMLRHVHYGRYHLYITDEKGDGNKKGLELNVYDNRKPEDAGRGVGMLSGGEKFLVSLALSIGMSSVAQKTGVQIDTLFIDEGFGTLDESSINDAMEILSHVKKANGMIGIISHVKLLEENIPSVLEIIKTDEGSSVRYV